jgi:hypothetical protein
MESAHPVETSSNCSNREAVCLKFVCNIAKCFLSSKFNHFYLTLLMSFLICGNTTH